MTAIRHCGQCVPEVCIEGVFKQPTASGSQLHAGGLHGCRQTSCSQAGHLQVASTSWLLLVAALVLDSSQRRGTGV